MRFLLTLLLVASSCCAETLDLQAIVKKVDLLFRSDNSTAEITMNIHTPNWDRTMELSAWSRGLKDTFIIVRNPKKDQGTATLRRGSEMWNYLPNVDRVVKVPPSMMRGSWMGSDFTNDDLVRETSLLDDYTASWEIDPGASGDFLSIRLIPNTQTITVWGKIILNLDRKSLLPTEQRYYDDRGELVRVLTLSDVKNMDGKTIPTRLEVVPVGEEDRKTVVIYREATFDRGVPEDVFSLSNLQKKH